MRLLAKCNDRRDQSRQAVASVCFLACLAMAPGCGPIQQALQNLSAEHPTARVTDVRITDIGIESLQLVFDVTVENPYSFDLPLLDMDYSLFTHGQTLVTGATAMEGKVSAQHARTVELPVRVDLVSLVHSIASVTPGDVIPYTAELALRAEVPGAEPLRFPLRKSGELPVPKAPTVRVTSLQWSEATINKVEGVLRLDVENTNRFPFSLSQLRWDLSLADTPVASGNNRYALALDPAHAGTLPVELSFSPMNLGTGLVGLLTNLNRETIDYAVTGVMTVETPFGLMSLPYGQSGTTRSESSP